MMTELISEVERINKIVQGLLSFARPSALDTSEVNIEQLINQTLLLVTNTLRKQNIEVEFEYFTDNTTIQADAEQLKQVFLNIILNAVEAMNRNTPDHSRTLNNKYRERGSHQPSFPLPDHFVRRHRQGHRTKRHRECIQPLLHDKRGRNRARPCHLLRYHQPA